MSNINPLTSKNLKGIWCSIQLPIKQDNTIHFEDLQTEIDLLTRSTVQGIYSNGTAAEFYNQTEAEFDRIHEMMATSCWKAEIPFQIGVSHMSPVISLERVQRTKHLQPSAYQIILPDWLPLHGPEISNFLKKMIMAAAPVPVVLYNPGHAKTLLTPGDYAKLSREFPELIGIKVGAGGAEWYEEMRNMDMDLAVFVPGHRLATGIKEGLAQGSYSNVACINPDFAQKWYETILQDIEEGLRMEKRILEFFDLCIIPLTKTGFSDAALDKLLWALQGRKTTNTRLRWPYLGTGQTQLDKVRETAKKMIPEFFDSTSQVTE